MPYRGEAMSGFAGHHRTLADLELVRPADDNVGRIATVGTPETSAIYHISQGNGWEPLVTAQTNALTGGIKNTVASNRQVLQAGRSALILGDSIALNNFEIAGGAFGYNPRGVFVHANVELGWVFDFVGSDGGVSGESSDQILTRVPTLLSTYDPEYVLIPGGFINDIAVNKTSTEIITNLSAILKLIAGRNIVWTTVLPSSLNAGTAARKAVLHACNRWLVSMGKSVPGLTVVDTYSAFVDVSTGSQVSTFSADNLHPNTLGAAAVSRAVVRALRQQLGFQPAPLFGFGTDDYKNMIYNPYGVGSNAGGVGGFVAGGLTGVGPNGWEGAVHATGTGIGSKVATSDEVQGEWATIAVTNSASTGSGAGFIFRLKTSNAWFATTAYQLGGKANPSNGYLYRAIVAGTSAASQPTWPTTVGATVTDGTVTWACFDNPVVGDTIGAAVEFQMDTWSSNAMPSAYIEFLDGVSATIYRSSCLFAQSGDTLPSYVLPTGILVIPDVVIPATTTNISLRVRSNGAASATGNFKIRRVGAWLKNR